MLIGANAFNDPAIELLFTHINGCIVSQAAFAAIKIGGILDPSNLEDLDEEDIGKIFTNMHRPPITVIMGLSIPVQGINVSARSQKLLIIAFRAARHYKSVGRDLNPETMKWRVLKDLDLQPTSLED